MIALDLPLPVTLDLLLPQLLALHRDPLRLLLLKPEPCCRLFALLSRGSASKRDPY